MERVSVAFNPTAFAATVASEAEEAWLRAVRLIHRFFLFFALKICPLRSNAALRFTLQAGAALRSQKLVHDLIGRSASATASAAASPAGNQLQQQHQSATPQRLFPSPSRPEPAGPLRSVTTLTSAALNASPTAAADAASAGGSPIPATATATAVGASPTRHPPPQLLQQRHIEAVVKRASAHVPDPVVATSERHCDRIRNHAYLRVARNAVRSVLALNASLQTVCLRACVRMCVCVRMHLCALQMPATLLFLLSVTREACCLLVVCGSSLFSLLSPWM